MWFFRHGVFLKVHNFKSQWSARKPKINDINGGQYLQFIQTQVLRHWGKQCFLKSKSFSPKHITNEIKHLCTKSQQAK